jgi:quercetin dioxygenase-like cupin family protein
MWQALEQHGQNPRGRPGGESGSDLPTPSGHDPLSPHHLSTPSPSSRWIEHAALPIVPSPSGLPSQHLVTARDGADHLFVGQQWLQPGDRVLMHTHPVEEVLTFLAGSGHATLGDETVPIGAGVSLYIPPGEVHGFRCTSGTLHVIIVFPVPYFAETTIFEEPE